MKESNPEAKVPPIVERVVMRCLEKNPDRRFQSAQELADAFLKAVAPPRPWGPELRCAALIAIAAVLIASVTIGFFSAAGSSSPSVTAESRRSQSRSAPSDLSKAQSKIVEIQSTTNQESSQSFPASSKTVDMTSKLQPDSVTETETKKIDIELKTSKPSNVFSVGDAMTILVVNRSNQPAYIELIATSTQGKKTILTPSLQKVTPGGKFRFPEVGKSIMTNSKPGQEQITVYASAAPFLSGTLQRRNGAADRVIHLFDPKLMVEKTITIETLAAGSEPVPTPPND